eukprot:Skav210451  [mRNA]  locus=scaffold1297:211831:216515:+ [translate_table: standard]
MSTCHDIFRAAQVIVVGAGAFAYENLRTAIEHGARHVTMLGRRSGTTCPKWQSCLRFYNTNKAGNIISFDVWKQCYKADYCHSMDMIIFGCRISLDDLGWLRGKYLWKHNEAWHSTSLQDSGLPEPECWAEGLLKPHNHTVSDLGFIAGYHGLATLRYGAEPLLDGAQFGSAKGRVAEEEQVSEEALERVGSVVYRLCHDGRLVTHPEFQKDLMEASGEPCQDAARALVLKDGSAVPAPGAGDALVLQISCNEVHGENEWISANVGGFH